MMDAEHRGEDGTYALISTPSFFVKDIIELNLPRIQFINSTEWFRSIDLRVMGPARYRCATVLVTDEDKTSYVYFVFS